ncbi:unnamed protein product [Darwinula stevensoni]|uniref:Major facilitator superfamily (MFS) profile domain-containing protein n=1 Tax=Darwinula stevensoni TaxID=69355 RepID=A0A7R8X6R2_9CRUS|nr:unnamed protein product [Darwinula stevensoni]CAG0888362.1 unnamed protein product [Darwinula stevensoni]
MTESLPFLVERAAKKFYRRRVGTVIIVFVISFAVGCENAIILPTAWEYLQSLGSRSETDLGILISAFNVGGLISSIFFGWIVDRWMHLCKPIVFVGAIIQAAGSVMYFLGIHKWFIVSGRFVCGLGSGILAVILAELARATSNRERTTCLTLGFGCRQLGLLLGPAYNLALHGVQFQFGVIHVNEASLPGLIFAVFWGLALIIIYVGYNNIGEQYISLQKMIGAAKSGHVQYDTFLPSQGSATDFAEHSYPLITTNAKERDARAEILQRSEPSSIPSRRDDSCEIPFLRPEEKSGTPSSFLYLLSDATVVILFMQITFFFCQYMVETIIPPTLQTYYGLGIRANSLFYLLIGCEAVLSFAFVILVRHRLLDRTVIMVGNVLIVVGLVALMVTTHLQKSHPDHALSFFVSSCTLVFLGTPMASVSSVSLASKLVGPESQGKMQALRRVASSLGLILGPLWAGAFVYDPLVLYGVTLIMFFIQITLFILSYPRMVPKCVKGVDKAEFMEILVNNARQKFYRRRLVTIIIAIAIAFAIGCENAIVPPTAWVYLKALGSRDETDLGILISAFNVGGLVSSLFFGWIVDRWMHLCKPIVFVGAFIQAAGSVMYFLGIHKWFIVSGRFICGLGSGIFAVILAELARATSSEERTKIFTFVFASLQLGLLLGSAYNMALGDSRVGEDRVNEASLSGLIFAVLWGFAMIVVYFGYENIGEQYMTLQNMAVSELSDRSEGSEGSGNVQCLALLPLHDGPEIDPVERVKNPFSTGANEVHSVSFSWTDSLFYLLIGCEAILSYTSVILIRNRLLDRTVTMAGNVLIVVGFIASMVVVQLMESRSERALSFFVPSSALVFLGIPMASVSSVALGSKLVGPESQGKMQALGQVASSVGIVLEIAISDRNGSITKDKASNATCMDHTTAAASQRQQLTSTLGSSLSPSPYLIGADKETWFVRMSSSSQCHDSSASPGPTRRRLYSSVPGLHDWIGAEMACHSCRGRIAGVCYKCVECVDYMICSTCEAYGVLHTGHNILRLTSSVSPLFHPVSGDVHQNVECESCHGPVRGSRYKCLQCPEVDLCHTCEARGTEHSHHLFIRLPSRIPVVPLTPDLDGMTGESFASEEHPGVSCNSCHQGVRGRRFKCLVCPDFNLCSNCEQSEEQHFHHPMIRFSKPSAIVLRSSVILPDGGIRGYRYKCLKCQDYDLCMRCEAASKHLHHRMLRIPPKCESAAHLPSNQLRPVLQPEPAPRERAAARAPYLCPCGEMCREKPRYVCLQCPSYGHCPQCEARKTHKEHIMLRVPEPTFAFNYQPGVRCGGCGNAITDIRYRCITCPGFHLCLTCEERKPHSNHPTLRMLARTNPAATEMNQSSAPLVHGRVLCTGCKGPIIGFRYECVSCQEVSLCGKCEEKDNTHLEHPLLRFPTFVAQR